MKRLLAALLASTALILLLGATFAGHMIVAPQNRAIGAPPSDFQVADVDFPSQSGSLIHGWIHEVTDPKGIVLLLHGIRADRRSMMGRARFLSRAGYISLAIDLQAHGESKGQHITLGKLEALDVDAALNFLKNRHPTLPIAIIGSSLGGASAILTESEVAVAALVVEATFSTVERATRNRMGLKLGRIGEVLSPMLTMQVLPRLGFRLIEVSPLTHIAHVKSPILIINGSEDQRTTASEARELYERAPFPKSLWIVQGAAHVDMHRYATEEYEQNILSFLRTHMTPTSTDNKRLEDNAE